MNLNKLVARFLFMLILSLSVFGSTLFNTRGTPGQKTVEIKLYTDLSRPDPTCVIELGKMTIAPDGGLSVDLSRITASADVADAVYCEIFADGERISERAALPDDLLSVLSETSEIMETTDITDVSSPMDEMLVGLVVGLPGEDLHVISENVGIGTPSPSAKLDITTGDANTDCIVEIESDTDNNDEDSNPRIVFKQDGGAVVARLGSTDGDNGFEFMNEYADNLYFGVGNTVDMTLSGGNVGIGTTPAGYRLDVSGTGRFTGQVTVPLTPTATAHATSKQYVDNLVGGVTFTEIDPTWSGDANTTGNIGRTGSVGIGTTSPTSTLDVNGTIRSDHYRDNAGGDLLNPGTGIGIAEQADGSWTITNADPNHNQTISIVGHTITLSDGGGSVTVPDNVNDGDYVIGNEDVTGLSFATSTGILTLTQDHGGSQTVNLDGRYLTSGLTGSGTTNYIPKWSGSTSLNNSAIYQSGSNIGIGTTSPGAELDVNGTIRNNNNIWFGNPASGTSYEVATDLNDGMRAIFPSAGDRRVSIEVDAAEVLTCTMSENVGIGTTTPASKLSVGGAGSSLAEGYFYQSTGTSGSSAVRAVCEGGGLADHNYGVYGSVTSGTSWSYGVVGTSTGGSGSSGRAYGVKGVAGGATSGYNYGVRGELAAGENGTAIAGVDASFGSLNSTGARYAGYFVGNVRTTGTEYVDGYINTNTDYRMDGTALINSSAQLSGGLLTWCDARYASSSIDNWVDEVGDVMTGNLTFNDDSEGIIFSGNNAGIYAAGENLNIVEPEASNLVWAYFQDDFGLYLTGTPNLLANGYVKASNLLVDATAAINDAALTTDDVSRYIWTPYSGYGLYWNTANNTVDWYGAAVERGIFDLDDGSMQIDGDLTVTGGNIGLGTGASSTYAIYRPSSDASSYGAYMYGSTAGGYFRDNGTTTYAYVGYSSYGVYAVGTSYGVRASTSGSYGAYCISSGGDAVYATSTASGSSKTAGVNAEAPGYMEIDRSWLGDSYHFTLESAGVFSNADQAVTSGGAYDDIGGIAVYAVGTSVGVYGYGADASVIPRLLSTQTPLGAVFSEGVNTSIGVLGVGSSGSRFKGSQFGSVSTGKGIGILASSKSDLALYLTDNAVSEGSFATLLGAETDNAQLAYSTVSTEKNIMISGSGEFHSGTTTIPFDSAIAPFIDSEADYTVSITPTELPDGQWAVTDKTPTGFTAQYNGTGNMSFDYIVIATLVDNTPVPKDVLDKTFRDQLKGVANFEVVNEENSEAAERDLINEENEIKAEEDNARNEQRLQDEIKKAKTESKSAVPVDADSR